MVEHVALYSKEFTHYHMKNVYMECSLPIAEEEGGLCVICGCEEESKLLPMEN